MSYTDRVVILVDMDCFYCQVEENLNPALKDKPIAVVQYNQWKGGGIIAVNYPARYKGVTRHMRGNEAKEKCPEIELVRVPNVRGKADLSKYRDAGKRVADVLQTFTPLLQRASVDEAYLDVTDAVNARLSMVLHENMLTTTNVLGFDNVPAYLTNVTSDLGEKSDLSLAIGGVIAEEIRAAVLEKTGYKCSAGIAHNKILAKLVCGLHKPNQQTILPQESIPRLFAKMPVKKITSLGGKFGNYLTEKLDIQFMGQLRKFTLKELISHFDEKNGTWLYNIARGIDTEPVTTRLVSKSIGCCKKFPGRTALRTEESIKHWLTELALEISERVEKDIEENNRKAKAMTISFSQLIDKKNISSSRVHPLNSFEATRIMFDAFEVIKKHCLRPNGVYHITYMGIGVGKFEDIKNVSDIKTMFANFTKKAETEETKRDFKLENSITPIFANCKEVDELKENQKQECLPSTSNTVSPTKKSEIKQENVSVVEKDESDSQDSISQEINVNPNENTQPSFFKNYLGSLKNEPKAPIERNFDTSQILNENEEDSVNTSNSNEAIEPSTLENTLNSNETCFDGRRIMKEPCPECGKQIDPDELTAHLDYHFALKMVREESVLYNTTPVIKKPETKLKSPKKSLKRKKKVNCALITSFLVSKNDHFEGPTETCTECNKKILVAEFPDHVDYHFAKKLHLELNAVSATSIKRNIDENLNDKSNNVPGISKYFKQL